MKNLYLFAIITFFVISAESAFAQNNEFQSFVNATSIEIKNINNPDDYWFLKKISKNKEIIGIGEASHGSETLFEIRNSAFKYLAANEGFTILLMEDDYGDLLEINRAIVSGEGDLGKLMKDSKLNGFWKTEAYLSVFQWMQNYNKSNPKNKLQVVGVDCQDARSVIRYVRENFPTLFKNQYPAVKAFLDSWDFMELSKMGKDKIAKLYERSRELFNDLQSSPEFRRNQKKGEYEIALNSFEGIVQVLLVNQLNLPREEFFALFKKYGLSVKDKRSEFMARNSLRAIRQLKGKAVLAVHNGHVLNYDFSEDTGWLLKKELGNKYFIIGTDFAYGSIQSFDYSGLKLVEIDKPEQSSLADSFYQTGKNSLFVSMLDKNADSANILTTEKRISSLPGAYKTIFDIRYVKLPLKAFDAFIYTEKIEPIKMLK